MWTEYKASTVPGDAITPAQPGAVPGQFGSGWSVAHTQIVGGSSQQVDGSNAWQFAEGN